MRILTYAVRPVAILNHFGLLSFVLALMTIVPLAASLLFGDRGYLCSERRSGNDHPAVNGRWNLADFISAPVSQRLARYDQRSLIAGIFHFRALDDTAIGKFFLVARRL